MFKNKNRTRKSRIVAPLVSPGVGGSGVKTRRHKPDYGLLVITALLMVVGIVVVYSISPGLAASQGVSQSYFITKQLVDVAVAIVAFAIAAFLPVSFWRKMTMPLIIAALVGSVAVMVTPIDAVYQAHRWIRLGPLSFQVAELIKLALIVWLAGFLSTQSRLGLLRDSKETLRPLILVTIVIAFVVAKLQSDLGSTGVMVAIIALMAYSAGLPLKRVGLIAALVAVVAVLAISTSSYRRDRLATYLNPGRDCQNTGYQACQVLISVGSGGVMGLGLGYSVQAYGYTPEASDDSIFAIMAEQFGFMGSVLILVIYGLFITRLKMIAERTADMFSKMLVIGVMAWLSTQMIINVGAMLGLLPLKGITLPLISQGGTSLVFVTIALGLVFQISRYTSYSKVNIDEEQKDTTGHDRPLRGRVGRTHRAATVTRPRT